MMSGRSGLASSFEDAELSWPSATSSTAASSRFASSSSRSRSSAASSSRSFVARKLAGEDLVSLGSEGLAERVLRTIESSMPAKSGLYDTLPFRGASGRGGITGCG